MNLRCHMSDMCTVGRWVKVASCHDPRSYSRLVFGIIGGNFLPPSSHTMHTTFTTQSSTSLLSPLILGPCAPVVVGYTCRRTKAVDLTKSVLLFFFQVNKRGKIQERALLITDTDIFKLDPRKHYQRRKSPLQLTTISGLSVSPSVDQGFVVHFQNNKDLICYMLNPQNDNRVAELVAVLFQICQR